MVTEFDSKEEDEIRHYVDQQAADGIAQQNGNEVNLTRLVEAGRYTDIADAIANEPATNPAGTVHVIEPGRYTVESTYRITYDNAVIKAAGGSRGRTFNDGGETTAVVIEGAVSRVFDVADWSNGINSRGVTFEGITFVPDADNTRSEAFFFDVGDQDADGAVENFAQEWVFKDCQFRRWGGPAVDIAADSNGNTQTLWAFGFRWEGCGFDRNQATVTFGDQSVFWGCRFTADASPGFSFGKVSQVEASELVVAGAGLTGCRVASWSSIHFYNAEGDGSAGSVAVEVVGSTANRTEIGGVIKNWARGIEISLGTVHVTADYNNITNEKLAFTGGANDHNESSAIGSYDYADVSFANTTQSRVTIRSTRHQNSGNASGNIPVGWSGWDGDIEGAGNGGWVYGGTSVVGAFYVSPGLSPTVGPL